MKTLFILLLQEAEAKKAKVAETTSHHPVHMPVSISIFFIQQIWLNYCLNILSWLYILSLKLLTFGTINT